MRKNKSVKYLIIGGGPTGLGAAWRLNELGQSNWLLVEQQPYFGGLATSSHDDKGFTWDFAVHVAHSHYHYFDRLLQGLLPNGFFTLERRSWVYQYGCFIPYPFQYNFRHLPEDSRKECLDGLLALTNNKSLLSNEYSATFKTWIEQIFGDGIAKHFMIPYNKKIWTVPLAEMSSSWLCDRVPVVDVARVLRNIEEKVDDVSWGPNHTFQFPKEGGTGAIWQTMGERLPQENIRLTTRLEKLDARGRVAWLSNGSVVNYQHLISTMPLTHLTGIVGIDALHRRAQGLKYSHTQVVGIAVNTKIPSHLAGKSWIYCPEASQVYYRVTPFSEFSPAHVPDTKTWCSFLCEVASPGDGAMHDSETLSTRVLRDINASGLMPETSSSNTHFYMMNSEFGYPVPALDRDAILNDVIPALEAKEIYSRGRFGGWKYEVGNMDHSLMQGVEVVNRLVKGVEEVTWQHPSIVNAGKR